MSAKAIDLGLTGYDELFMSDKERAENRLPKIQDIPISEIDDFPDHPFHVRLDADMDELVQSVKERGIITPITLRQKEDGRYEIVSGHRRRKACELAGLDTVKAEVKDLSRDEAIILMVESNLQRTTILPSEKAFAYKMRLEAMKRQGKMRENQGYIITDSINIGEVEFVIGELPIATAPSPFVTWECRNGNNYFWGHYFSDGMAAKRDLLERAGQELDYQERMRNKPAREKELER